MVTTEAAGMTRERALVPLQRQVGDSARETLYLSIMSMNRHLPMKDLEDAKNINTLMTSLTVLSEADTG